MESGGSQVLFAVVVIAVGIAGLVVIARTGSQMLKTALHNDLDPRASTARGMLERLSIEERKRAFRLAQSESRIDDPGENERAKASCAVALASMPDAKKGRGTFSLARGGYLLALAIAALIGQEGGHGWLFLGAAGLVSVVPRALIRRYQSNLKIKLLKTAEMNDWEVTEDEQG